jgi:LVIVD repeat-containing protein
MGRKKGLAGLATAAAALAVLAFVPASAVAHPCATAQQTFLSLNGGSWAGLPSLEEEADCSIIDQSGLTVADTTQAAASAVPDAVSSFVWSANMTPLGHHARNVPFTGTGSTVFNSDLAFQGNYAYQGTYDGYRILDVSDPANPTQIVNYTGCGGTLGQGDVVVWGNTLIRSWDVPVSAGQAATTMCAGQLVGQGFEGIHIFDISNPASPILLKQLRMANTGNEPGAPAGCGSHTDTIVPDVARGDLYLYIGGSSGACTGMDIVRVDIANPADAVYLRRAAASRQCHDNNVIMGNVNLAMCAGGNGLSVFSFDPSIDPEAAGGLANPTLLYSKPMPGVTTGHSGSFTYDGKILVFGHEPGGGSQAQCQTGSSLVNRSIYFIEPRTGTDLGSFTHQRAQNNRENCTWHNFNIVPTYKGYVFVSGNYQKGISVVDFTNPAAPREFAFADPAPLSETSLILGGDWSTYWHNGTIYESDIRRGLTTWSLDDVLTNRHLDLDRSNPQTQTMTFDLDSEGPVITIDTPVAGADYAVGSVVQAAFGCTDANAGVESCVGTVAGGSPINTATTGAHTFTVTATDKAGNVSTKSVVYNVLHDDADGNVNGTVPGTLSLTVGPPATFGAFVPGVAQDYFASTMANVISTAGQAALTVADPSAVATGHLVNGAFAAPAALQARARNAANPGTSYADVGSSASPLNLLSYAGPVSNDPVTLEFKQSIGSTDPLRTGTYSKTLTFTLSTTTP